MLERIFRFGNGLQGDGRLILVIEDSEVDRSLIDRTLVKKGYTTVLAADGRSGIDAARTKQPDLIVLDFMLPDLKGPDICRILKESDATKNIPVVFLTSLDTAESLVDSYDKGADNYITKPFHPKDLLRSIDRILKDQVRASE